MPVSYTHLDVYKRQMLMLCAAIPASIVSTKYTKSIYSLSLEQLCANRQKNYIQSISTSKAYVMNIKLYQAGSWLIEKYQRIRTKLFRERKTVNKRRCLISSVLECLPEIVAIYIGIDTALDVIGHKATIGDYSLFCGLAAQLSTAVITMLSSFVAVYDNQQKTKNFQMCIRDSHTSQEASIRKAVMCPNVALHILEECCL